MLLLVVPGGNHYYHKVVGAEVLVYLFFRYLGGVLGVGRKRGITVNVVGLVGQDKSCDQQDREKRRNHEAGLDVELADCGYVRNEVAVMSLVDERREGHQQTRHQREYNEDTEEYRLAEYDTEVKAELELHEHHRDHTGKGGKAGRRYLRDSLTERRYDRVAGAHGGSLFRVSVAEDYRVVDGERELKNYRDGV